MSEQSVVVEPEEARLRKPWWAWLLMAGLAIPAAALYGLLVTLVGRSSFLTPGAVAELADLVDGMAPHLLVWLIATVGSVSGWALVAWEVVAAPFAERVLGILPDEPRPSRRLWGVALGAALTASVTVAAALAWAGSVFTDRSPAELAVFFAAFAGMAMPVLWLAAWMLLVLRRNLEDDGSRFDDSIESTWFSKAAAQSFWDLACVVGLLLLVLSVLDVDVEPTVPLLVVALVSSFGFPLRLWLLRRKEARA